jgi:ribosomal protection tetracycline resistance protein
VLDGIAERLTPAVVAMGSVRVPGTRPAVYGPHAASDPAFAGRLLELLAEHDDALLGAYLDREATPEHARLRAALAAQTRRALVHPVFLGSARTGAGVDALIDGLAELLPATERDTDGPASGTVFKIERDPAGERIAYVRMRSGAVRMPRPARRCAGPARRR